MDHVQGLLTALGLDGSPLVLGGAPEAEAEGGLAGAWPGPGPERLPEAGPERLSGAGPEGRADAPWLSVLGHVRRDPPPGWSRDDDILILSPTRGRLTAARLAALLADPAPDRVGLTLRPTPILAHPRGVRLIQAGSAHERGFVARPYPDLATPLSEPYCRSEALFRAFPDMAPGSQNLPRLTRLDLSAVYVPGGMDVEAAGRRTRWSLREVPGDDGPTGFLPYDLPVLDLDPDQELTP